jgi:hypothetical protein
MLDTIAWDVRYTAPPGLDATWRALAEAADGLVFLSRDGQRHFERRFSAGSPPPSIVSSLSTDPTDYTTSVPAGGDGPDCFVVGNEYDHKDVAAVVELLSSAFPYRRVVALGRPGRSGSARVTWLPPGQVPDVEVGRLFATSGVVLFPSYYEGFGLPLVAGLAHGRTVLVRRSPVIDEVLRQYRGPGRVAEFEDPLELVELVGRALAGDPVGVPGREGSPPPGANWDGVAGRVADFLLGLTRATTSRWASREQLAVRR